MGTVDVATLQAKLVADTKQFTTKLKAAESLLDKFNRKVAQQTKQQAAANDRAGRSFRNVAITAAAAGAAYAGIAKGKEAIAVTTDLAKTTAALSKTLGMSTQEASAWGAVAKSRSIDNRALQMSFATLSRQVLNAQQGSKSAIKVFGSLGISQRDLAKGSKDTTYLLGRIADGMGRLGPGAAKAATMAKLLGRGWRDMGPLLREGSTAMNEQLSLANKYGLVMGENQVNQLMKLVAAQRELKMATMGLQVAFAQAAAPILQSWTGIISQLLNQARSGDIGGALAEALSRGVTAAVSQIGQMAPRLAQAFAQGFLQAPPLGQLMIGAWITSKMGLWSGLFGRAGSTTGATFARSFAKSSVIGLGILATIEAIKAGINASEQVRKNLFVSYAKEYSTFSQRQLDIQKKFLAGEQAAKIYDDSHLQAMRAAVAARQQELNIMRQQANLNKGKQLGWDIAKQLLDQKGKIKGAVAQLAKQLDALPQKSQAAGIKTALELAAKMEREGSVPKGAAKRLALHMAKNLDQMKPAAAKTIKSVANTFGFGFAGLDEAVQQSLKSTVDAVNRAGKALGVQKPVTFSVRHHGAGGSGKVNAGTIEKKQKGGVIGGHGRQDSQLIKAAPGEVVLTRHQQAMVNMGASVPEALRNRRRHSSPPKFARGGRVVGASMYGGATDPTSGTIGYRGDNLTGTMAFAELGMGKNLGNLPYRTKLDIGFGGKTVTGTKLDIGAGGGNVNGHRRDIDLWYQLANALGFGTGTGLVTIAPQGALGDTGTASIPRFAIAGMPGGALNVGNAATAKTYQAATRYLESQQQIAGVGGAGAIPSGSVSGLLPRIAGIVSDMVRRFGLSITSTTGGRHTAGSWHYSGHAADLAGSPAAMMSATKYAYQNWGSLLHELFYDPWGGLDEGHQIGAIGGHSDHVHIAAQRGAKVKPAPKGKPKPRVKSPLEDKDRKKREAALAKLKKKHTKGLGVKSRVPHMVKILGLAPVEQLVRGWELSTGTSWDQVMNQYANLEKHFDLSDEQFLVTKGDSEVRDDNAIAQRVQELIALRQFQTGTVTQAINEQAAKGEDARLQLDAAVNIADKLIKQAEATIERERERQKKWRHKIEVNQGKIATMRKKKKKPKGWQQQIALWQHDNAIYAKNIEGSQSLIEKLEGRRRDAITARGDYADARTGLAQWQTMEIPASLFQLRFDRDSIISSLDKERSNAEGTKPPEAPSYSDIGGTGSTDQLEAELARAQERARIAERTAKLSEAALAVFRGNFAGTFHTGGIISGSGEKIAHVQGGEGIFTRDQMAAMGGSAGDITVNIHGDAGVGALISAVDVIVDGKVFSPSPQNQRRLADSVVSGMSYQGSRVSPRSPVTV